MDYLFEQLGEHRFQHLCQALLLRDYPALQCLPIGQPDGGRDGFARRRHPEGDSYCVLQVKFSRDPSSKSAREALERIVRGEHAKIERLRARGANEYILATNLRGTAHLDAGSIDRMDALLSELVGMPARCLWRDDLARRIDASSGIKWSFPEILKAQDLLEKLLCADRGGPAASRATAIRAYLAHQAKQDAVLKFKQLQLESDIDALFVDVPATLQRMPDQDAASHAAMWNSMRDRLDLRVLSDPSRDDIRSYGAVEILVKSQFVEDFPGVVLQGAPGQGKSTVAQYLCQANRLLFLNRRKDFEKMDVGLRPTDARIPFKIDLRDYASWLAGRDPFSYPAADRPPGSQPVLEALIAAQVRSATGLDFSVADFVAVARTSQVLVVLDGFDEVANPEIRNKIVGEVGECFERLKEVALHAQFVITSRPAVFANSPGFSRSSWPHVELVPLTRPVVHQYAGKWLRGRYSDVRERESVLRVLNDKMEEAHVAELARSPMQLAILLSLISVQGESLPDKRTALYDEYVKIFLNRESEKSPVVRDNRVLLLDIHKRVAWLLHSEVETDAGAGHVSEERLRLLVSEFLQEGGFAPTLLDQLFVGMVERVVMLVSRVQGTYEFEVQPLREYFAARYLYDGAPYSPPGSPRKGNRLDRFEALARNPYWSNVTRFFAGCCSEGEQPALIFVLEDLLANKALGELPYVAQLAFNLVQDNVFNRPVHARRLLKLAFLSRSFSVLLASDDYLDVPLRVGGIQEFLDLAEPCFSEGLDGRRQAGVLGVLREGLDQQQRIEIWARWREGRPIEQVFRLAERLAVLRTIPCNELIGLAVQCPVGEIARALAAAGRDDVFAGLPELWSRLFEKGMSASLFFSAPQGQRLVGLPLLAEAVGFFLWPFLFVEAFGKNPDSRVVDVAELEIDAEIEAVVQGIGRQHPEFQEIAAAVVSIFNMKVGALAEDPGVYEDLIGRLRKGFGDGMALYASVVTFIVHSPRYDRVASSFADSSIHPLSRVALARSRADDVAWWVQELSNAVCWGAGAQKLFAVCALVWMPTKVVVEHASAFGKILARVPDDEWAWLTRIIDEEWPLDAFEKVSVEVLDSVVVESPRLLSVLLYRLERAALDRLAVALVPKYAGRDGDVWQVILRVAIRQALEDDAAWSMALDVIKRATRRHQEIYASVKMFDDAARLPLSVAQQVFIEPMVYPTSFVLDAVEAMEKSWQDEIGKLGVVARENNWFEE